MIHVKSDSWDNVIQPLIKHRELTTNTEEYDDPASIAEVLTWWMKDENIKGHKITAEKDMNRSSYKNPWYIIRLVPDVKTNKEAKVLLESEY